jgi:hypothetical protein
MTVPSGVVDGDILVMAIEYAGTGGALNTLTGWTFLTEDNQNEHNVFWRVAASEPASYVVTSISTKASGTMIALSGASQTAPVAAQYGAQHNASAVACVAPALGSWSSTNGIDLYFAGWLVGGDTLTGIAPASYTNAASSASTGGAAGSRTQSVVAYRALSAVTTVGSLTASDTTAAVNNGLHVFISAATPPVGYIRSVRQAIQRGASYMRDHSGLWVPERRIWTPGL